MLNYFKVEKTGFSFWDSIGRCKVYEFRYKHSGKTFLANSRYSFFRVDNNKE